MQVGAGGGFTPSENRVNADLLLNLKTAAGLETGLQTKEQDLAADSKARIRLGRDRATLNPATNRIA
jgi:hypothetical protein